MAYKYNFPHAPKAPLKHIGAFAMKGKTSHGMPSFVIYQGTFLP
jgi:hypothetical protein